MLPHLFNRNLPARTHLFRRDRRKNHKTVDRRKRFRNCKSLPEHRCTDGRGFKCLRSRYSPFELPMLSEGDRPRNDRAGLCSQSSVQPCQPLLPASGLTLQPVQTRGRVSGNLGKAPNSFPSDQLYIYLCCAAACETLSWP